MFSGQLRAPFKTTMRPKTFDDAKISSDVIYVTQTPVAFLVVTLAATAIPTIKLQTFV